MLRDSNDCLTVTPQFQCWGSIPYTDQGFHLWDLLIWHTDTNPDRRTKHCPHCKNPPPESVGSSKLGQEKACILQKKPISHGWSYMWSDRKFYCQHLLIFIWWEEPSREWTMHRIPEATTLSDLTLVWRPPHLRKTPPINSIAECCISWGSFRFEHFCHRWLAPACEETGGIALENPGVIGLQCIAPEA